jgi:hypothetical protein
MDFLDILACVVGLLLLSGLVDARRQSLLVD